MTAIKGTKSRMLVDQFDFSSDTAGIGVTVAMGEEECTTLQAAAALYTPILPSMKLEHNGYLRAAGHAGDMEQELKARLGVSGCYVAALFGTDVAACPAYVLDNTFGANLQIAAPAKGLITLNGAWGMGNGGHRGVRIFSGQLAATGAQTAVDLGAAGSAGGEAYLFVQAVTGSVSNGVILVESSATEGGSYATEATFDVDGLGSQKQSMIGTVNRWVRVNLSNLGGATALTFVMIACVQGVTE